MNRLLRCVTAAGVIALVGPATTLAQPARFEVSPYLGYRFGGGLKAGTVNQPTLPGLEDLQFSDGLNLGLSGTIRAHEGILVEVFGERMSSNLNLKDNDSAASLPGLDVGLWYLHAGVNWEVNNSYEAPLRPLVGVSVGATVLDPDGDRSSEARLSVGILLGVKYFPGDTFGFRLHGRFLTTYLAENGAVFQSADGSTTYTIPESTYMSQFDISAGVVIPFGMQ
jgi:hypothetical protein